MHCKFLKLTNGDNIIVTTDDTCATLKDKEYISVVDPVVLNSFKFSRGPYVVESYVMEPWIKVAKEDVFQIPTSSIVIAVDVEDNAITYYKKYLDERKNNQVMIKSGEETKEIIQQAEAEQFEEEILNIEYDELEDEMEEEHEPRYTRDGRTIH